MRKQQSIDRLKQKEKKRSMSLTELQKTQKKQKQMPNKLQDYESFRDPHLKSFFHENWKSKRRLRRLQKVVLNIIKNLREEKNSENKKKRKNLVQFLTQIGIQITNIQLKLAEQRLMKNTKRQETVQYYEKKILDEIDWIEKEKIKQYKFSTSIDFRKNSEKNQFSYQPKEHSELIQFIEKKQEQAKTILEDKKKSSASPKIRFYIKSSKDYDYDEQKEKLFHSKITNAKLIQYIKDKRKKIIGIQKRKFQEPYIFLTSSIQYCFDRKKEEYFQKKLSHQDLNHYLSTKRNLIFMKVKKYDMY